VNVQSFASTDHSLAGQVHARLRSDIVHARLRPGELLSENQQAMRLGVSRTPVREAIQGLVREGWVHVLPQRGSRVSLLSMPRIHEALFVREAVETHVIRSLLNRNPSPTDWSALDRCIQTQGNALQAQDLDAIMQADAAFHRTLLELCGMGAVWSIVAQARDMHQRVRAIAVPELQSGEQALKDHRDIVQALRQQDSEAAILEIGKHLQQNVVLVQQIATLYPEYFEGEPHADRLI